ncbi:ovate family protein 8 [Actinidia rufa]|uniref:Transcription repressor n=1 Tax=Actinidia rufa TaxID=165716 RepID=A0A7J0F731_9ERIC|nr:ovate family protein 8 [Actinidia rufa]
MAKRLKLRIFRVIQSCRSKDPSNLPEDPVPSFLRLSHVDFPPATTPPSKPHRSSFKRHVFGCGLTSKSSARSPSSDDRTESLPAFQWQKEEQWHVIAVTQHETPRRKIYNSSASDDDLFPPPPPPTAEAKKRRSRKKKPTARFRISTSSAESGLFSDEREREESETLVSSSRSFSTDSSSEKPVPRRRRKKKKKGKRGGGEAEGESGAARLSVFKRMIPCAVEGKVKESFAVVKKSEDPYKDFKRSMVEMILEKQMFEERELEQLLQCFLSLNSRHHHGVIVQAFAEICEALFCRTSTSQHRVSTAL